MRDAIECYKRALISADPHEITLYLKLAKAHKTLEEYAESVAYHQTVVQICQADCTCSCRVYVYSHAQILPSARPIPDYSKSILEISEYEMKLPSGNLTLARDFLELVASSNAEEVTRAADLLKEVKAKLQAAQEQ